MKMVRCHVMAVLAFVALAVSIVDASPRAGEDGALLVQVEAPSEHDATVLQSLKDILEPLKFDIKSRTDKVEKLQKLETDPIEQQLSTIDRTIQQTQAEVKATQKKIDEIPERIKNLKFLKESNNASVSEYERELSETLSEGQHHLNQLQKLIGQSLAEERALQKLLEWLDTAQTNWEASNTVSQLQSIASSAESSRAEELKKILMFLQTRDESGVTPAEIRAFVSEVAMEARKTHSEEKQAYTNLTLSLNHKRAVLEDQISNAKQAIDVADTQLKNMSTEEKTLLAELGTLKATLRDAVGAKRTLKKNLDSAKAVWEVERKQLAEISMSLDAVYASMGVIV